MAFIDGENLAIQGRKVLESSGIELPEEKTELNWPGQELMWLPGLDPRRFLTELPFRFAVQPAAIRAHYYSCASGSSVDVEEAKNSGIAGLPLEDETALRVHPGLGERIREGLLAEAAAAGLPSYQRPQRVALLPEPLSEDAGMLTKGLKKVVPKAIVDQYRDLVEETYRS